MPWTKCPWVITFVPCKYNGSIDVVIQKLQNGSQCLAVWKYESNYLKPNPDIWHLLLSDKREDYFIKIGNECISNVKTLRSLFW